MPTNEIPSNQHNITLPIAIAMTSRYRENRELILDENFRNLNILPLSETFNKEAFKSFIENTNCKAIRIYYGMDESFKTHAIIVGVNDANEDMLPSTDNLNETEEDPNLIIELATRCPPDPECPKSSSLNTP